MKGWDMSEGGIAGDEAELHVNAHNEALPPDS